MVGGDADTSVGNPENSIFGATFQIQLDGPTVRRIAQRVLDEVPDQLVQACPITTNNRGLISSQQKLMGPAVHVPRALPCGQYHVIQVDGLMLDHILGLSGSE